MEARREGRFQFGLIVLGTSISQNLAQLKHLFMEW